MVLELVEGLAGYDVDLVHTSRAQTLFPGQAAAFVAAVEDDQPGFFCLSDMFDGDRCQVFSAHH